jgi:hypothetical protein
MSTPWGLVRSTPWGLVRSTPWGLVRSTPAKAEPRSVVLTPLQEVAG